MLRHVLVSLLFSLACIPAAAAAPQITFDHPVFDFGAVLQGKKVEHSFSFKNTGTSPLIINQVKSSCGCTVASSAEKTILPGKGGTIKTTFDTASFGGDIIKSVYVSSNDPVKPTVTLSMKGAITEEIIITPRAISLDALQEEKTREFSLTITNKGTKPLVLSPSAPTLPTITLITGRTTIMSGGTATISASITPHGAARIISGYLAFKTDNPLKPELRVPVYGTIAR